MQQGRRSHLVTSKVNQRSTTFTTADGKLAYYTLVFPHPSITMIPRTLSMFKNHFKSRYLIEQHLSTIDTARSPRNQEICVCVCRNLTSDKAYDCIFCDDIPGPRPFNQYITMCMESQTCWDRCWHKLTPSIALLLLFVNSLE